MDGTRRGGHPSRVRPRGILPRPGAASRQTSNKNWTASEKDALRLLYVSHYNYYRNFETLFRALPRIRERLGGRKLRLFLTCRLRSEDNPGSYRASAASALVEKLGIGDSVVELGAVPYSLLHQVYRAMQHVRYAGLRGIICASAGGGHGQRIADRGLRFGGASRDL